MAKKKNSSKKHKFKHAESAAPATSAASVATTNAPDKAAEPKATPRPNSVVMAAKDYSYVGRDIRRILILAGCLVVLELVLYYVLVHTSVGDSLYSLVKI